MGHPEHARHVFTSTAHGNLHTDGSGTSFCDVKEDHESCMSEGLMLDISKKETH